MADEKRDTKICGFCEFAKVNPTNVKQLFCKRYPPTVNVFLVPNELGQPQKIGMCDFPVVEQNDWCGEFVRKNRVIS